MAAHDLLQRGLGSTYMANPYYSHDRALSYYASKRTYYSIYEIGTWPFTSNSSVMQLGYLKILYSLFLSTFPIIPVI